MSKYGHRTMNWFEAIVNKIGGEEAADAFLRDELVVNKPEKVWKTWETIRLGTFKNVDEIRKALETGGYPIHDMANNILDNPAFTVSKTEQDIELVNVSIRGLGFDRSVCYTDICKRAFELGLDLCPAEVGPQLRLQCTDQTDSRNCIIVVAMNDITGSDSDPSVFRVDCGDSCGKYLGGSYVNDKIIWDPPYRFVFIRRKSTQN